jgi:FkbM family methyltransferase
MTSFEPHIVPLSVGEGKSFLIGTPMAQTWYDPLREWDRVELEWILANVDLGKGRKVIDGGCHHGYYSVAMGGECELYAVDMHKNNLDMVRANCALNGIKVNLGHAAIADRNGVAYCSDAELGMLNQIGTDTVRVVTLKDICKDADVVKLDIEGAEFIVFPNALKDMPTVDTWIVEVHPWGWVASNERDIFTPFLRQNFELFWIDRAAEKPRVERMNGMELMKMQSTIIAKRRQ